MKWTWVAVVLLAAPPHFERGQASSRPSLADLDAAVMANELTTVESLLARGVPPWGTSENGTTALMLAASGSRGRPYLMAEPDYPSNIPLPDWRRNDVPIMEALLARGANINARDDFGRSALWWSGIYARKVSNMKFLLERGADVNAVDKGGSTALVAAVRNMARNNSGFEIVQALVEAHADVNVRSPEGVPVLMMGMWRGPFALALLRAGANPNATGPGSRTALMGAIAGDLADLTQTLLDFGADVNAEDSEGRTPLVEAVREGNAALVRTLIKRGARLKGLAGDFAVENAAVSGTPEVLQMLLQAGANPNARLRDQPYHQTVLMEVTARSSVVRPSSVEPIEVLLRFGADVNAKTTGGDTALMMARGEPTTLEVLLKGGANVNAQNATGYTALILAAGSGESESVRVLLAAKADFTVTNHLGLTALGIAIKNGHVVAEEVLRKAGAVK